jgi:sugar diacid utilization regulator
METLIGDPLDREGNLLSAGDRVRWGRRHTGTITSIENNDMVIQFDDWIGAQTYLLPGVLHNLVKIGE